MQIYSSLTRRGHTNSPRTWAVSVEPPAGSWIGELAQKARSFLVSALTLISPRNMQEGSRPQPQLSFMLSALFERTSRVALTLLAKGTAKPKLHNRVAARR